MHCSNEIWGGGGKRNSEIVSLNSSHSKQAEACVGGARSERERGRRRKRKSIWNTEIKPRSQSHDPKESFLKGTVHQEINIHSTNLGDVWRTPNNTDPIDFHNNTYKKCILLSSKEESHFTAGLYFNRTNIKTNINQTNQKSIIWNQKWAEKDIFQLVFLVSSLKRWYHKLSPVHYSQPPALQTLNNTTRWNQHELFTSSFILFILNILSTFFYKNNYFFHVI